MLYSIRAFLVSHFSLIFATYSLFLAWKVVNVSRRVSSSQLKAVLIQTFLDFLGEVLPRLGEARPGDWAVGESVCLP